ncbi:hypothetical protein EYF80_051013 [Liparis tanakae]|uniref:Uncharacterized protein n=1 Tax=Liparis tanakae TaxID=230148 RepID=A0A4Z2FCA6_9TELE|nr:hypothetical protein EYF80_051013 [Liparis tanakae]
MTVTSACVNRLRSRSPETAKPHIFHFADVFDIHVSLPASAEPMSASSSSLTRSSLLCSSWTKCPPLISVTRPTSRLRSTLLACGGQSGPLSTSSDLWSHGDGVLSGPSESLCSTACFRAAWVSTGMTYVATPSPNSSRVERRAAAVS